MRRNPWGAGALGAVAGAWRVRHRTGCGSSYSARDAVASLRLRSSGWLRSEKGGAAVPSVAQSETTDPRSAESAS
jgi:hypothetical protein